MSQTKNSVLRVFISYRRFHGGAAYAYILHQRLEEAGIACFYDIDSMRDYSDDFDRRIQHELTASDYVVVLLQSGCMEERANQEDYFLKELRLARDKQIPIICLPIDPHFSWDHEQLSDDLVFMSKLNFAAILRAEDPDRATEALLRRFDADDRNIRPLLFHKTLREARRHEHSAVLQSNSQIIAADIEDRWAHAKRISLLAIGCQGIIKRFTPVITKKYREGVSFRFVSVDPESAVADDIIKTKLNSQRSAHRQNYLTESMESVIEVLTGIGRNRTNGGSIEYRLIPYAPTCTIQWVECENQPESYFYVELLPLYGPNTRQDLNIAFLVRYGDPAYSYYAQQFNSCWERSAERLRVGGRTTCEYCELIQQHDDALVGTVGEWRAYIADNQNYPGRLVICLNRHAASLSDLRPDEWASLRDIIQRSERMLIGALGATCVNWTCMMNSGFSTEPYNPHVHLHAIPRYDHDLEEYEARFRDGLFGSHYTLSTEYQLSPSDRAALSKRLRNSFAEGQRDDNSSQPTEDPTSSAL